MSTLNIDTMCFKNQAHLLLVGYFYSDIKTKRMEGFGVEMPNI
jgi:hypothetical protein